MPRLKTGVLISGRGSNLQALIDACRDSAFPADIVIVISNKADAAGLAFARAAGIAAVALDPRAFADRAAFDLAIHEKLAAAGVELVCLAGYMRLLSDAFIERWPDRIINIHPSLLPAFRGLNAHGQALAAGVRISGCTVHVVRPDVDAGPIVAQAAVPVLSDDTVETLADRILVAEHRIYPLALRLFGERRVRIDGDRTIIAGTGEPGPILISPARPESECRDADGENPRYSSWQPAQSRTLRTDRRVFSMSDVNDVRPHLETWHGFVKLVGYFIAAMVILLGGMALFLL